MISVLSRKRAAWRRAEAPPADAGTAGRTERPMALAAATRVALRGCLRWVKDIPAAPQALPGPASPRSVELRVDDYGRPRPATAPDGPRGGAPHRCGNVPSYSYPGKKNLKG